MFSGHSLSQQRADNDPQDGSPGRTREGCSGLHGFPVDTSATAQAQRCKPRKAIHSAPPPRAGFRKANHLDPLEIDRDNRDNRDKSRKPLQRKAFRFSIMPNEPGHSRDKPGQPFAGHVTTSQFLTQRRNSGRFSDRRAHTQAGKSRANDYLPRPFGARFDDPNLPRGNKRGRRVLEHSPTPNHVPPSKR